MSPPSPDEPVLSIHGLVAGYAGKPVARLGALNLGAGGAGLLLGPSGAGKTTLLLAIAGLAKAFAGQVRVGGTDIAALPPSRADRFRGRTLGLIFQDLHLVPGLSTLDNLLLAPFAAGLPQDRARALQLLDGLGLAAQAFAPAETLSRGQAQRAAIARAMVLRPKLILADEPTASLDDEACTTVSTLLIKAAAETGAGLLIATHDQRLRARIETQAPVEPVA